MSKKTTSSHRTPRTQRLFDNLLKTTYEFIKGRHYAPQSKHSLMERLNIHPDHLEIFEGVLHSLKTEGKVHLVDEKYHHVPQVTDLPLAKGEAIVRGAISVHPRGFGFVDQPPPQQDIFIPKVMMNGAVDGDIVDVITNLSSFSEKGPEGKVALVVERKHRQIVGTVVERSHTNVTIYSSLLGEMHPIECRVQPTDRVKRGDRVLLDVLSWGQKKEPTQCSIAQVLGNVSDPKTDIPFAILEGGI